jgi:hypothetical protein
MNRRDFLQLLGAAGAMAATGLSLEELLAPEKTIFLPSTQIITNTYDFAITEMPANLFIPSLWSNEILAVYKNNLVLANLINGKYIQHVGQRNPGNYHIFENRVRQYQGLYQGQ